MQLEMTFDTRNRVKDNLREGSFSVFVEYSPPSPDQPFKLSMLRGSELSDLTANDSRVASMAFTEGIFGEPCHDIIDVLSHLKEKSEKEPTVFISGRNMDEARMREAVATLRSLSVNSMVLVTGFANSDHPHDRHSVPVCDHASYMDSVDMIAFIRKEYPDLFLGAVVNPFKYTISDAYLQYYKLIKKLNSGASFIVTEAGWDMRKFQELQWFLQSRHIADPVIARILLVRPSDVQRILDLEASGIVISREFASLLQRESGLNDNQAMSVQLRRVALQAVGCRLMGYSGVQIAGEHDHRVVKMLLDRIEQEFNEIGSYANWLEKWNQFHNDVEMAPVPHNYYIYSNLLETESPEYDPEHAVMNGVPFPDPEPADVAREKFARAIGLQKYSGVIGRFLKSQICRAPMSKDWTIGRTQMQGASGCPKGIEHGACGGALPDGTCEFRHQRCFYHKVISLASSRNDLDSLEKAHVVK